MTTSTKKVQKAVTREGVELPRFQMSEMGYAGLKVSAGIPHEEMKKELQFPQSIVTFKQMSHHSTIAAALSLYDMMISKVKWRVKPVEGATEKEIQDAKFIQECMHDMDHSWMDFVQEAGSMKPYGFAVHEKVFRKRLKSKGSKFDDGLIGWQKLPIRSQDSIDKWFFDQDGREIIGVQQNLNLVQDGFGRFTNVINGKEITLPRKKFLLFRTGKHKGNPFGKSCLRDCYYSWRYLVDIEEREATGVQRDLAGVPCIYIPPQYMSADASPEQKQIYEYFKNIVRNIQFNQQAGLVMPQAFDPDSKQPLFKFELISSEGGKNYDTTKIKEYYKNAILTALFADLLILGQGATGSYALGGIKSQLMAVAIEALLKEIQDVVNNDLIRHTFELNGWDTARMPTIQYEDFEADDLEAFSKAIQRFASTSMLEVDRAVLNKVRESIGVDVYPDEEEPHMELMPNFSSKSGEGLKSPFEGTRTSQGSGNDNDANMDNAG
jgi:hypothetical protein